MIRLGLKLWNINTKDYLPLAVDLYRDKLFDYIELYIVPGNLDKIKIWQKIGIPFDIHAPHSAHRMNLSQAEMSDFNLELYKEVKHYADELDGRYIVFHGGTGGDYKEASRQLKGFEDKRILIENKPFKPLSFVKASRYTGSTLEEIKYIIDYSNCGFCLDTGHAVCAANSFHINPYEYINKFMQLKPSKIHLSDININTEIDEHMNFSDGSFDFKRIKDLLITVGDVTVETNKCSSSNLDDFVRDVTYLKNLTEKV